MSKGFKNLEVWQEGFDLLMKIYRISAEFPEEEKYSLTSQLRRSANSIIANIAESQGRYYFKDKIRTLYIARGEIEETRSHLRVTAGLKYYDLNILKELDEKYETLTKRLSSYINYLSKRQSENNSN